MPTRFKIAKMYAYAYGHRATQTTKKTTKQAARTVNDRKVELTVHAATSSVVYLTSRVAGFNAGYKFAKKTPIA